MAREREYRYRVDGEGRVFHDGSEVVDPATLRFFLLAMTRTAEGSWMVLCQGERNWFEADETPFVVQRVRPVVHEGAVQGLDLVLAGGHVERLDPRTLESDGGRLRCLVRKGAHRGRFGRVALAQLGSYLVDAGGGEAALVLAGERYLVREATARPGSS